MRLAAGFLLVLGATAQAQVADMGRATCGHWLSLAAEDGRHLATWLDGYFAGAAHRTALDVGTLEAAVGGLRPLCTNDPALPLLGAEVRALFLGQPGTPPPSAGPPAAGPAAGPAPSAPLPERPFSPAAPTSRPTPLR